MDEFPFPVELDRIVVTALNLEKYLSDFYNKEVNLIQYYVSDGWLHNHSYTEIAVTKNGPDFWDGEWSKEAGSEEISKWLEDESDLNPDLLLWDLCNKGFIPPGNYLVEVYW